ncbi:hypothetical protein DFJ73DRAFT_835128, partial [Zopfochytrium polystomum]
MPPIENATAAGSSSISKSHVITADIGSFDPNCEDEPLWNRSTVLHHKFLIQIATHQYSNAILTAKEILTEDPTNQLISQYLPVLNERVALDIEKAATDVVVKEEEGDEDGDEEDDDDDDDDDDGTSGESSNDGENTEEEEEEAEEEVVEGSEAGDEDGLEEMIIGAAERNEAAPRRRDSDATLL